MGSLLSLKQLHFMRAGRAATQLENISSLALFRIIGTWLIKDWAIIFYFLKFFQKNAPLTGLLHQWEAQTPPSVPSWCPSAWKSFSVPVNLRFYFYFFPDQHGKVSSASPHYFLAGLGEITNQDCAGLPAKAQDSKLAWKKAGISLPNGGLIERCKIPHDFHNVGEMAWGTN